MRVCVYTCADPEERHGIRTRAPTGKSQKHIFLAILVWITVKSQGSLLVLYGSSDLPSSATKKIIIIKRNKESKKRCQSWTSSDKTL